MKAMILAAGYGTRLKPLTEKIPKALIKIYDKPLLELVIRKLIATGVKEIIINVHHFAEQIEDFLNTENNFGIHIELSKESEILGTGGGLKKAAWFFDEKKPFFLHNVDILSTINLAEMYDFHLQKKSLATLALKQRQSKRFFILDENNFICGHEDVSKQRRRIKRNPAGEIRLMPFSGIHVISPQLFKFIERTGAFSIVDIYLDLIEKGLPVIGYRADKFFWKDIGKMNTLTEVKKEIEAGKIRFQELTK